MDASASFARAYSAWGKGFKVRGQGVGFRVQGSGCWVQGSGFGIRGAGCRMQGSGSPAGSRCLSGARFPTRAASAPAPPADAGKTGTKLSSAL